MICDICGKETKNMIGFSRHLKNHNLSVLDYFIEFKKFEIPKCKCGKELNYINGLTFSKTCGNTKCKKSHKMDNKTKLKISKSMKKLSKEGKLKGWSTNKDKNRRSYPEKFFIKLMEMNNLFEKYTIKEKLPFGKYFLDFAFLEIKSDVEIDGQQHFVTEEAMLHDEKRDKYTLNKGWKVYRITWLELKNNPKKEIEKLKIWLKDNSNRYHKYNVEEVLEKLKKPEPKFKHINGDKKEKLKDIILKNDVDFSKKGWIKKISVVVEKEIGLNGCKNMYRWIKNNMTDFHKERCYKRTKKEKIKNYKKRKDYFLRKKNEYKNKNIPIIKKIKDSDIDFTKQGWVKQVSKIIGISENKGGNWVKKNMNDFYNEKCWKRKTPMV